jgi:hypothetical protein
VRKHHADGDGFAMQQAFGIAGRGFQRVREGMAEVEERALAGFAFVAADDQSLGATARGNRFDAFIAALENGLPVLFQPGEKLLVVNEAVFRDFGIAGAELARWQAVEHAGIGEHEDRLMKCADEVLALAGVDAGLAADGGVDLREERSRDLHEIDAAQNGRRGEAREIADDAAAERDEKIAALDAGIENGIHHLLIGRIAF